MTFQVFRGSLLFILGIFLVSCENKNKEAASEPSAAYIRGRTVYQTQCIACHNANPHRPGSLGPEVFGSSKELLEARILRAAYPNGYSPKRVTKIMVALPHLKDEIEALHTFLNQPEK